MVPELPRSPIIEHTEGDVLPGIVSIDKRQLCNDAAILANSPLCVSMPQQRWSYGILLPLNIGLLPNSGNQLVIRLDVSVRGGAIGIAGVDASGSALTTAEHTVGDGTATVRLTISDARATKAVFLRTVSAEAGTLTLTLLDVAAHAPAKARRAEHHALKTRAVIS